MISRHILPSLVAGVFSLTLFLTPIAKADEYKPYDTGRFSEVFISVEGVASAMEREATLVKQYDIPDSTPPATTYKDAKDICYYCRYDADTGSDGYGFRIATGWGKYFNNKYYLGFELNATKTRLKDHFYNFNLRDPVIIQNYDFKQEYAYQLVLRPGYRLAQDSTAFLRLGIERGKFEHRYNGLVARGVNAGKALTHKESDWENGLVFGIDKEVKTSGQTALKMGWEYVDYGTLKHKPHDWVGSGEAATDENRDSSRSTSKNTVITNFHLGLVYRPGDESEPYTGSYHDFGGFYGGLLAGYINEDMTAENSHDEIGFDRHTSQAGIAAPSGGVTLGWGRQWNRFYLGLEATYNRFNGESKSTVREGAIIDSGSPHYSGSPADKEAPKIARQPIEREYLPSYEMDYEADISARFGYVMGSRSLVYTKVGYAFSKYDYDQPQATTYYNTNGELSLAQASPGAIKTSDNLRGIKAGVGIDSAIGERLVFRTQWDYTKYGKENVLKNIASQNPKYIKPHKHQFNVGLLYGF